MYNVQVHSRDERTVIFYDPIPLLNFWTQSKSNHTLKFFSWKVQAKWSPKYYQIQLFNNKYTATLFPKTQSKSGPVPTFLKRFTVRTQSKSTQIRYGPDVVQPKPSPILISGT